MPLNPELTKTLLKNKKERLAYLCLLLDVIGVGRYAQGKNAKTALAELEQLVYLVPEAAAETMEILISCLVYSVRCEENTARASRVLQNYQKDPTNSLELLDQEIFRQYRGAKALAALHTISEDLQYCFSEVTKKILNAMPDEDICIVLLSEQTPPWLCKVILAHKKFLDIIGYNICVPYYYPLPDNFREKDFYAAEEQSLAEIDRIFATAEQAVDWFYHCDPKYLPPAIDRCPLGVQHFTVNKMVKILKKWPPDKLLALIAADFFPAWIRKAAEKCFAEYQEQQSAPVSSRLQKARRRARRKKRAERG